MTWLFAEMIFSDKPNCPLSTDGSPLFADGIYGLSKKAHLIRRMDAVSRKIGETCPEASLSLSFERQERV